MARAVDTDFLQSMRFQVEVDAQGGGGVTTLSLKGPSGTSAGFSAVTTPELSSEAVEYREGLYVYTRKFPGVPTQADITMSRGVARRDTSFFTWIKTVVEGAGAVPAKEYRIDFTIKQYDRETSLQGTDTLLESAKPVRSYVVKEAFCIRCKPAGDLDATASDVSIKELDCAYEQFSVTTT